MILKLICLLLSAIMPCWIAYNIGKTMNSPEEIKKKIISEFNSVKWEKQVFFINETKVKDSNGNTSFYPSKDVDKIIETLNNWQ